MNPSLIPLATELTSNEQGFSCKDHIKGKPWILATTTLEGYDIYLPLPKEENLHCYNFLIQGRICESNMRLMTVICANIYCSNCL